MTIRRLKEKSGADSGSPCLGFAHHWRDLLRRSGCKDRNLDTTRTSGVLKCRKVRRRDEARVRKECETSRVGHSLHEDVLPFSIDFERKVDADDIATGAGERTHKTRSDPCGRAPCPDPGSNESANEARPRRVTAR